MKSITFYFTSLFIMLTFQFGMSQIPTNLIDPENDTYFEISNTLSDYFSTIPIVVESDSVPEGGLREEFYKWDRFWENRLGLDGK